MASSLNRFASKLPPELISELVIGSDDESALRRAVKETLPSATNVLCSRHIKKNLSLFLENKVGLDENDKQKVKNDVFGVNGLIYLNEDTSFEDALQQIKPFVANRSKPDKKDKFNNYVDTTLRNSVRYGLMIPFQTRGIPMDWTNNNCESINNMLKSYVNWKKMQLPLLISKLREIVLLQEQDVERALIGTGNYYLAPHASHYRVDPYFWGGLTSPQKRKKMEEFVKNKRRARNMVTSSDERLMVLSSPTGGRKPGEPRRKKAKKTYTPSTQ